MAIFSLLTRRSLWARLLVTLLLGWLAGPLAANSTPETGYDIVVYGGTSAGVVAAVQARQMGKSVVLIEPSHRLGGLTSGGLGQTDIGNKAAIGGLARRFYQAVREHYRDPAAWKWQRREEYMDSGQTRTGAGEDAMWTFEPSAALKIFETWVKDRQVEVVYGERLDRGSGVALTRAIPWRILALRMESGRTFRGRMFIDATYEGDLMAAANVSYAVGREANSVYGETLNGVQTRQGRYHQFVSGVDPYVRKGDPASGLLPFIDPAGPGPEGAGDRRVQAYCFRMCLTDHPDNRIPFRKPDGYDPLWYELLLRNFEAGESGLPWINSAMPNRKTDTNNRTGFSTDFIGQNYEYPEATYDQRERIIARHLLYQQGLMWTLANHPRVPEHIRREVARWGMCKDEFSEGDGWQNQLYVREARRMVSDYIMTQHHCQGREQADDPVGLAAYGMDSHHVQRYVDASGQVRNEGDVEVGGFAPYPISYRSIIPRANQCANLLVPICLSASHIAYGSIRMEPVFMVLGQSAATAAAHAIDESVPVQRVDGDKLRRRLLSDGQILAWKGPQRSSRPTPDSTGPPAHTWERWDHALTSTRNYANPYADVTLRVVYTGPAGRTLRAYGFWDGGDTFRIRCAFPGPGTWRWETECSDTANTGLHRQRGTVVVAPYAGDGVLYRHGFLKVSENRRYLTYGDGTPFLWMGDTAWSVPQRATDEEWAAYLADRTAKHFTLLQVGPASAWAGPSDRRGEKPFTDQTCSQWNPAYWQSFEQKIQRANEAGLVVLLVGLMEPVHRYPETDKACLFARNIIARLFGNFVIFSPSFDSKFMPLANEVGRAAREATAVHLITQHPGTPWNEPTPTFSDQYYDESYLDIAAVQTGHNGGHLDWCAHHAIEWVLHLYRHEPHKPIINLEAMYDAQGEGSPAQKFARGSPEKAWRAVDARSLAWRSWLSGAMGYTYGAGDVPPKVPQGSGAIWKWVTDPEKYDFWKKALQWDSAFQIQYLHDFLAALEWWRLEPAHHLVRNQPDDVMRRMVLAKTAAGDLAVAYLPGNEAIELEVSAFPAPLAGRWFDPVRGGYTTIAGRLENLGTRCLAPPTRGDWVLLLQPADR
jgi:hypothetical protein